MSSYGDQPPQDPYGQTPGGPPPPPTGQPGSWGQAPGGPPPPPPTGQPGAYGQPYGAQPGYGAPTAGYGGVRPPYSFWGKRVGATLIDLILTAVAAFPLYIGAGIAAATADPYIYTTNPDGSITTSGTGEGASPISLVLILVGVITYAAFFIWNTFIKQGRTGYTIGKGVLGIKLVREADGSPIGGGMAFVRQICHILDGFCYIGYLWPLWDAKRQTFADKIINTVVLDIPKG